MRGISDPVGLANGRMTGMLSNLQFAGRLLKRDWRSGELSLLLIALVIAVASIASVGFFVDRMRQALSQQATQLLGADLVLSSDSPPSKLLLEQASKAGLKTAEIVVFPSMALVGDKSQLSSIKAVTPGYPLRGSLQLQSTSIASDVESREAGRLTSPVTAVSPATSAGRSLTPKAGEAWVDPQLLSSLDLKLGDEVQLGEAKFRVSDVIILEPDRGANFVNFAPRVMIAAESLASTGLIQPASRVTYRLLFAGEPKTVKAWKTTLEKSIELSGIKGQRVESLEAGRPELKATLDRAEQFLGLVGFLSALIAAVAVGLAARRFVQRHLDACAVMKAMGMTQGRLVTLLLTELLMVAFLGAFIGGALGWGVHWALIAGVKNFVGIALPAASFIPWLQAGLAGLVLLLGFAAWPFMSLAGVPPLRVLRRELEAGMSQYVGVVIAALSFGGLLLLFASNRRLALIVLAGFAAGALVFALASLLSVAGLSRLRRGLAPGKRTMILRLALASLTRRRMAVVTQTVALAVGLMALLVLTITRTDLIEGWRRASPADAPDKFVINIQPEQKAAVSQTLMASGLKTPELSPMIRGRLIEINGKAIKSEQLGNDRAQRLVEREFNLSYMETLPSHNKLLQGRWFDPRVPEVSAEEGIMKTLDLRLGDEVTFDVAGEKLGAKITSVRKVSWDSMKVNFFMILSPALLEKAPQTFITAYHQPKNTPLIDQALVKQYPNLTVFDTGNIVRQIQTMLEQVVAAVQVLFVLTLLAGLVVLYGALSSSRDEREQEAGLMRALGASRSVLARAQLWELVAAGALAGFLAGLAALALGSVLAETIFEFSLPIRWSVLLIGAFAGGVLSLSAGWFGLRKVFQTSPMETLRRA